MAADRWHNRAGGVVASAHFVVQVASGAARQPERRGRKKRVHLQSALLLSSFAVMKVTTKLLARAAREVLGEHQVAICAHIKSVTSKGRYSGIEKAFADPFDRHLVRRYGVDVDRRAKTSDIGSRNFFSRLGEHGKVDAVYRHPNYPSAAEYKAVRMPRRKGNPLFDISQISADGQRMRKARALSSGWVIIFVYGPLVEDCPSDRTLFRDLHNQLYLECQNAIAGGLMWNGDGGNYLHTGLMRWHSPPYADASLPGVGVKVGRLGAVIIECRPQKDSA